MLDDLAHFHKPKDTKNFFDSSFQFPETDSKPIKGKYYADNQYYAQSKKYNTIIIKIYFCPTY